MSLKQLAIDTLAKNDRGRFTIPTAGLYPYQWNWDSAFVALGIATYDMDRAWAEVTSLIEGQWPDGMIPSIIFRSEDPDYFPGPSRWGKTPGNIPSTGVSQPPVLATIVRQITRGPQGAARRAEVFDALFDWHKWWHEMRSVDGIVATVHPWETGRDNCPEWNIGLDLMETARDLPPYTRKDNTHVDPRFRPTQEQYDKYLTIVHFGGSIGWDQRRLTDEGPFLIENLRRIESKVAYMLPSWDPDADSFEPQRYWCGPLWPQMNYMAALGLDEHGEHALAQTMRDGLCDAIERSGFWECFNPLTGEGCVGADFSWTAAIWLSWQHETKLRGVA